MEFKESEIAGCYEITPRIISDERGSFVKTFHKEMFLDRGLECNFAEEYYSISKQGVLRGMHFQRPPHHHAKLVYCVSGKVIDVVVDLDEKKANAIYIPPGLAHGFYTLSKQAMLIYKVTTMYAPDHDTGIRWDSAGIEWPNKDPIVSIRDQNLPQFGDGDDIFK